MGSGGGPYPGGGDHELVVVDRGLRRGPGLRVALCGGPQNRPLLGRARAHTHTLRRYGKHAPLRCVRVGESVLGGGGEGSLGRGVCVCDPPGRER